MSCGSLSIYTEFNLAAKLSEECIWLAAMPNLSSELHKPPLKEARGYDYSYQPEEFLLKSVVFRVDLKRN